MHYPAKIEVAHRPLIDSLVDRSRPAWDAYTRHAFVRALGDGTLPRKAFLHYLRQDYIFLVHFSRAWSLAAFKAETVEDIRQCASTVHALTTHEMPLHVQTCEAEGITLSDLEKTDEEVANIAYTRFVMDCGLRGDLLDLLVALTPCVFGYGAIGNALALQNKDRPSQHPYADWIRTYASPEYQDVCHSVSTLLDRVAHKALGDQPDTSPRWTSLVRTFNTACVLESNFWQMGLNPP